MKLYHGSNVSIEAIDLKRGRKGKDIQFQIECITNELIIMLMDDYEMSMEQALDTVYGSNTYKKIERPSTGLYYQGAVYVMDMLKEELGKTL